MVDLACIIDDDQIYVFGLRKLIDFHKYSKNLLVFKNGAEAIKYMKPLISTSEELPDVILLDINMPVMDGWQFLDEFVKIKPMIKKKITIYMVSSSIDQADIEKAKTYQEVSDFIVKPVKEADLAKILG
ncbi:MULTISPECIES: response regulator [unclassified Imperialibacter]|jgi:CheY-like chemotaxis protein|uniref:response regulator n=1 Tax=unclassified Imperialibacter TaxID=2629706 RepID=UPI00125310F0|nr:MULTISPECIES: response regulator [unclassified Imperialibacter]CAD5252500.1 Response regulator receiver domain-containing protein [Imperialibacter sp. 89]CAD5260578.1 Response regulator receiver domain-containing protein [Imperialibacter sp. 75]VVT04133.1 Response regulator receiver domain-containing protein [Imperialibacter sp. EC-SDR9]